MIRLLSRVLAVAFAICCCCPWALAQETPRREPSVKQAATRDAANDRNRPNRGSDTDHSGSRDSSGKGAASLRDRPAPAKADGEIAGAVIQEPSQGRPIFITPGDTFYFVMSLPNDVSGDVTFSLKHAMEPGIRMPLKPATPPSYNGPYCSLLLQVPEQVASGLYDIEVKSEKATFATRRSVKVIDKFKDKFRIVHLSNMNIGDLTAPNFDEMLPREVNLLAPEFILATGDYTEWARARDDASSWQRVLKYFEEFNAPVFMLCGSHDHEASFSKMVASKPVDKIDYGNYHGLLLLDHPGNPIDQDLSQVQWIESDLRRTKQKKFTFIVSNSDELALLDIWRENGNLADFVRDHKIKLFITGGSSDWDFKEFADKLKDASGLQYIRTHESSTCMRDRATGFSHFRVIDIDGDKVSFIYPDDTATEKLQHSIPTGRLRTYFEGPNDGTSSHVTVTVQNALNQSFNEAHVWMRVAKGKDQGRPVVAPGRLVQSLDCGNYWACDVALNLPDKSATKVEAATNPEDIPPALPIEVEYEGSRDLAFAPQTTDFGLTYYTCDAKAALKLTSRAKSNVTCWPVVRLNGSQIHIDRKAIGRLPLTLEPGKPLTLPLVLDVRRVSPGAHALQVYFLEDPLSRMGTYDVTMSMR